MSKYARPRIEHTILGTGINIYLDRADGEDILVQGEKSLELKTESGSDEELAAARQVTYFYAGVIARKAFETPKTTVPIWKDADDVVSGPNKLDATQLMDLAMRYFGEGKTENGAPPPAVRFPDGEGEAAGVAVARDGGDLRDDALGSRS